MRTAKWSINGAGAQPTRLPFGAASRRTLRFGSCAFSHIAAGFCFCFLLSVFCFRAYGQSYSINWYKIAGGGGTSTGGVYSVSGTIGQHDAGGPLTGGNYSLTGGFWALISVVQTPGAPNLYITHSGNTVTVYWQNVSGWTLRQNPVLNNASGWTLNTSWATGGDGTNRLNLVSPPGNLFFRLSNP